MVSDILETAVLERRESVVLEGRSSGRERQVIPEEADVWDEGEHEDDLLLSLGWIRNIG